LVAGRNGRRLEVGPKDILLEYDESLIPLRLSRGPSKDGHDRVETAFLQVRGAKVTDMFEVLSADFVKVRVKLGFTGHFETADERCFAVEDPVKLLADTVRAQVREAAAGKSVVELLQNMSALVRNALFGDDGTLRFDENGMVIEQVDVLSCDIVQPELARLFQTVHVEAVRLQLQGEQAERQLNATKHKDDIEAEENAILVKMAARRAEAEIAEAEAAHQTKRRQMEFVIERERLKDQHENAQAQQRAEMTRAQRTADADVEARALGTLHAQEQQHRAALAQIDRELAQGMAQADAIRLQAIQQELVGALHAAADAEVMKAAAENMNLVALLGNRSPADIFSQLLRGTPLQRSVDNMLNRSNGADDE